MFAYPVVAGRGNRYSLRQNPFYSQEARTMPLDRIYIAILEALQKDGRIF
ncbi:MAG: Lrp/AsnC family transcriptional regulator [Mesorhizobium sp.]|nr:MAG: Lrp/AsnC family transcriptional regulator [Mesorhizobium sp.]